MNKEILFTNEKPSIYVIADNSNRPFVRIETPDSTFVMDFMMPNWEDAEQKLVIIVMMQMWPIWEDFRLTSIY